MMSSKVGEGDDMFTVIPAVPTAVLAPFKSWLIVEFVN